jgi:C-terminal processing protease CtpA/Prc
LNGENRAKRIVTNEDRYAILQKPLGIILEEGDDGMVFIAKIDPAGNAAQSGFDIRVGDVITAVSATFGDEVWSTRGVGLDRVLKSIKIRSGDFVTLVLESLDENQSQKTIASKNAEERRKDAREKFGAPVMLDPITLTPINQEEPPQDKGFFNFFK